MKTFLKQYFYLLDHEAKKGLPFLLFLYLTSSFLDVIGIGLVGVFLALIANPTAFSRHLPFLAKMLAEFSNSALIFSSGLAIITAFIFKALAGFWIQQKTSSYAFEFGLRLKLKLFKAFQYAPYAYHLQQNSAYFINKMNLLDGYISQMLVPSLQLLSSSLISICIIGFLLYAHALATVALIFLMLFIVVLNNKFLKNKSMRLGKIVAVANAEIIKNVNHGLRGLQEIRVLGTEAYFSKNIQSVASEYAHARAVNVAYQYIPRSFIESMMAIFMVSLCYLGMVSGASISSTVAFIGVFAAAGVRLMPIMSQLTVGINQMRFSYQTMLLVYEQVKSLDELGSSSVSIHSVGKLPFAKFELNSIHFRYENTVKNALCGVSLSITRGQSLGLVGTSGAGKSTLVGIILGMLAPTSGEVLVDGVSITDRRGWLNNFAYIPQQIFLMDDTLKRNIALGISDGQIDEAKLEKAICMAKLDSVVLDLPEGVHTIVGENGIRLSGGQRQRVALARAFYHEREIIVMDEATSSLDNETEKEVIEEIKSLKGLKTLIVIAHRLTTIEHCDQVIKLEKGEIVKVGSYEEVCI